MFSRFKNVIKLLVVLAILAVPLFGISCFGLGMDMGSPTANCPFGGHLMSVCEMNPMDHIQERQSIFTTLPAKDTLALLSLLFAMIGLLKLWQIFSVPKISKADFYIHRPPIFNSLQEAFSKGILNPKIFW